MILSVNISELFIYRPRVLKFGSLVSCQCVRLGGQQEHLRRTGEKEVSQAYDTPDADADNTQGVQLAVPD